MSVHDTREYREDTSTNILSIREAVGRGVQNIGYGIKGISSAPFTNGKNPFSSAALNVMNGYRMPETSLKWASDSYLRSTAFNLADKNTRLKEIDNMKHNFLLDSGQLSSYSTKQLVLDEYFHNLSFNHNYISMRILKSLIDAQVEIDDNQKSRLLNTENPEEALHVLNVIMTGDDNPKKKAFIQALAEIEGANVEIVSKYKRLVSEQNPLIEQVEKYRKKISTDPNATSLGDYFLLGKVEGLKDPVFSLTSFSEIEEHQNTLNNYRREYPEADILEDMEKLQKMHDKWVAAGRQGVSPVFETTAEKFPKRFRDALSLYYGEDIDVRSEEGSISIVETERFEKDIRHLRRKIQIEKVHEKHNLAVDATRELLMQSFFLEGGLSLSSFIPHKENLEIYRNDPGKRKKLEANFMSELRRGVGKMDEYRINKLGLSEDEFVELGMDQFKKFFDGSYGENIDAIDEAYGTVIQKGVPPGEIQENVFQKMFIDGMYNDVMSKIDGTKAFNELRKLSGDYEGHDVKDIVDVKKNAENGLYSATSTNPEYVELYSDAEDMHNLILMFKKAHNGEITKGGAEEILNKGVKFLKSTSKAAISENIDKFFEDNKITQEDMGIDDRSKTPESAVQDYISAYNARSLYEKLYGDKRMYSFMEDTLNMQSRRALDFISCLERAESPAVSSQSTTSETRGCVENFIKELEKASDKRMGAIDNPMIALCGFVFFILLTEMMQQATMNSIKIQHLKSTWEEAKAIAFVSASSDPIEKAFREKAIIGDKEIINDGVVEKGKVDEYIFRSAKAQHDLQKMLNPYLGPNNKNLSKIEQSFNLEQIKDNTKSQMVDIFEHVGIKDAFNEFISAYNTKLGDDYLGKYGDARRSVDLMGKISSKIKNDSKPTDDDINQYVQEALQEVLSSDIIVQKDVEAEDKKERLTDILKNTDDMAMINEYTQGESAEKRRLLLSFKDKEEISITPKVESEVLDFLDGKKTKDDVSEEARANIDAFTETIRGDLEKELKNISNELLKKKSSKHNPEHIREFKEVADVLFRTSPSVEKTIETLKDKSAAYALSNPDAQKYCDNLAKELQKKINSEQGEREHEQIFRSFSKNPEMASAQVMKTKMREFVKILNNGIKDGGLQPSKMFDIHQKLEKGIAARLKKFDTMKEDFDASIAQAHKDIDEKAEELKNLKEVPGTDNKTLIENELKILKNDLMETKNNREHLISEMMEFENMRVESDKINMQLENIINGVLNSNYDEGNETDKAQLKAFTDSLTKGSSLAKNPEFLEVVDRLFSQQESLEAHKGSSLEDKRISDNAFMARYTPELSAISVLQDLKLLDEFNKMLHTGYDVNGKKVGSAIPRKHKKVSEAIAAIKVSLREAYISSQLSADRSLKREDVLRQLYEENREEFVDTADISFGFLDQDDGNHVQIFTVDKTENPANIKQAIDAVNAITGEIDLEMLQDEVDQIERDESLTPEEKQKRKENLKDRYIFESKEKGGDYLRYFASISATSDRYKSEDRRGLKKPKGSKNIKVRSRWTESAEDKTSKLPSISSLIKGIPIIGPGNKASIQSVVDHRSPVFDPESVAERKTGR